MQPDEGISRTQHFFELLYSQPHGCSESIELWLFKLSINSLAEVVKRPRLELVSFCNILLVERSIVLVNNLS